ncbi:MAG: hypothetical protein H0W72_16100 [Planctomycetes bacterium]|nr:hypothetical protein [Planctomycetota bacterium]
MRLADTIDPHLLVVQAMVAAVAATMVHASAGRVAVLIGILVAHCLCPQGLILTRWSDRRRRGESAGAHLLTGEAVVVLSLVAPLAMAWAVR